MNPYSLIAKIKKSTVATEDWTKLLGESENEQAEKAARFLSFINSRSVNNPNGATAEFARNLDSLLRPGADSRIDLASAYAGLEGMFNEIFNQLPSPLGNADCRKALKYDELCNSKKYREEVLAPYRASVRNFDPNSMLGEIILCMAIINECRKIKKDPRFEIQHSASGSKAEKLERFNNNVKLLECGFTQLYLYKLYAGNKNTPPTTLESDYLNFKKSQLWELVFTIISCNRLLNLKDFGLKLILYALIKLDAREDDPVVQTIDKVWEYRNMLNHGAFHSDEVKEHTAGSRDERANLAGLRKLQHADAVASMLVLLILLVYDKSDIKISKTKLLGYKLAYYASYAPVWTVNRAAMLGTGTILYVVPKLLSIGLPVAFLILAFAQVGSNMTPKGLDPEMKLAAFDAMLDGDTVRLIALRDKAHFDSYSKSTRSVRETKPASETTWRLREKTDREFKNGRNLYPHPGVDFYPMQSQLDDYMKTQLRILANEVVKYADGNPVRLGVGSSATSVELEHNPVLHDVRYAAVEAYLRSILPPNISVERLDRKEHHVSVNFYIIPNDA